MSLMNVSIENNLWIEWQQCQMDIEYSTKQ